MPIKIQINDAIEKIKIGKIESVDGLVIKLIIKRGNITLRKINTIVKIILFFFFLKKPKYSQKTIEKINSAKITPNIDASYIKYKNIEIITMAEINLLFSFDINY